MPQIIGNSPFDLGSRTVDTGPGQAIGSLGNIFSAFQPQPGALDARLKVAEANRLAAAQAGLGQIFASTGAIDPNVERAYLANGGDVDQLGKALRLQGAMTQGVDSDQAARAAVGIGGFNSTPLYQQRAEQAATARQVQASQIAAQAAIRQASLEPVAIQNADGTIGWTTKGAIAAGNQPKGAQPMLSPDQVKGAIEQRHVLPDQGAPPMTDAQTALVQPDTSKLQLHQVGTDALGNPQFGVFDPATGKITPAPQEGAQAQAAAGPPPSPTNPSGGLHGPDFLATVPPQLQEIVKAIDEGRAPLPNPGSRNRQAAAIASAVMQYDPAYDPTRYATRQDFGTKGKNGVVMTAAGTALEHLGDLLANIKDLHNNDATYGGTIINSVKNAVKGTGAAGSPLTTYNENLAKLSAELEKFYAGGEGTEADRKADIATLSPNLTPSQLYAGVARLAKMLQGKTNQLQAQRDQILKLPQGADVADFPVYSPGAKAALTAAQQLQADFDKTGKWGPQANVQTLPGTTVKENPLSGGYTVGDVVEGREGKKYVYKGGDYKDLNNWRIVPGGK